MLSREEIGLDLEKLAEGLLMRKRTEMKYYAGCDVLLALKGKASN